MVKKRSINMVKVFIIIAMVIVLKEAFFKTELSSLKSYTYNMIEKYK